MFNINEMENQKITLDDVLDKFSMFGRYHLLFMAVASVVFASSDMLSATYVFAIEDTGYRCIDEAFINKTCGIVEGARCTRWVYDNPHSFIAEFQLACQEWKKALVGTAHGFGIMIGLLVVGPLSDRIGRKKTVLLTGILRATIGLIQSFSPSYWFYVTMEFLAPAFGDTYSPLFVLNMEIVSTKKRVIFHMLCGLGSIMGGILFSVTAWGIPYWRNLLRAIYLAAFVVFAACMIDESPRWLLSKGRKDKTIEVLQKMGEKNKVKLEIDDLDNLHIEDENKGIAFVKLLKLTIRSRTLVNRCMVCIVWWITSTFVSYGTIIGSISLQGNKYINYALLELVDLPGNFVIIYILNNYKRKNPLLCTFFTAAILFFVHSFLPSDLPWLSVMVYMISRLMSSFYFTITYIYTSELFPTYTRNSMHAMCSSIGRVGAIIAPQTPLLLVYWSSLPSLLFGLASLCAGLVTFLVPDTADDPLPDTVREAESVGDKRKSKLAMIDIENLGMT